MSDLSLCQQIPPDVVAQALGGALIKPTQPFHDDYLGDGCQFDAGQDRAGQARFGYAALAPITSFEQAKTMGPVTPIENLGDAAFTSDGADAQQLWVLVKGKGAIVVAIGDVPNPGGAQHLARYLVGLLTR